MKAVIFIGSGKISYGKLSQALEYGALTVQIAGDFDDAMARVQEISRELGIYPRPIVSILSDWKARRRSWDFASSKPCVGKFPTDCRPRWEPGEQQRFREKPSWSSSAWADRPHSAAGGNQCGRPIPSMSSSTNGNFARERAGQDGDRLHYYDELDARKAKADTIASAIEINRPVNLKKCLREPSRSATGCPQGNRSRDPRRQSQVGAGASAANRPVRERCRRSNTAAPRCHQRKRAGSSAFSPTPAQGPDGNRGLPHDGPRQVQ